MQKFVGGPILPYHGACEEKRIQPSEYWRLEVGGRCGVRGS